jgi:hypothetical protein
MDVIHMSRKIPFVADEVFPIPALPDAAFSFARPAGDPAFPWGKIHGEKICAAINPRAPVPHCIPPVS